MIPAATKKVIIIVAVVAVATLFVGIAIAELGQSSETTKDFGNGKVTNKTEPSFYEQAYAKATSAQKAELDKIIADKSIELPGEWRRAVLIAVGDLPKDQPRLTAKQAGEIYDRIGRDERTLEKEFNKIAGAPDFVGGSGIGRSIYYLNENRTDTIFVMEMNAYHVIFSDDGTQTTVPLGHQTFPVIPDPSQGTPETHPVQPTPTEMPMPSPT
jgi:hypothetical protein